MHGIYYPAPILNSVLNNEYQNQHSLLYSTTASLLVCCLAFSLSWTLGKYCFGVVFAVCWFGTLVAIPNKSNWIRLYSRKISFGSNLVNEKKTFVK